MDQVLFRSLLLYLASLMLRSLCIGLLAGVCALWVRNVAARHAIWMAVMIAMLVMPFADAVLPATWIPARVEGIAIQQVEQIEVMQVVMVETVSRPAPPLPATAIPMPHKEFSWWSLMTALYALVGLALLARLGVAHGKIAQLKRRSRPVSSILRDKVAASHGLRWRIPQLRESDAVRIPITIGFLRPVVILPVGWEMWEEFKLTAVLGHEFAHVRRFDWAIATVAAFNKCVFWLNPLAFFLERNLSELAERACDDAALNLTHDAARYAEVLLQFATAHDGHRLLTGGVAMARHNMRSRIERVLAMKRPGSGVLKLAGWTLVLVLAMPVLYAASAIQVSSNAAPAPSYGEIIAQLPLPGVPQQNVAAPQTALTPQQLAEQAALQLRIAELHKKIEAAESRLTQTPPNVVGATYRARLEAIQRQDALTDLQQEELRQTLSSVDAISKQVDAYQSPIAAQDSPNTVTYIYAGRRFVIVPQAIQSAVSSSPKVITRVEPFYPPAMRTAGIEGSALLSVTIGPDGHVFDIKTVSQTNPALGTAAIDAVKQWVFEPSLVAGKPATITVEVPVDFKLLPQAERGPNGPIRAAIIEREVNRATTDALLNLPDNEDDLLAYLSQLAKLRGGNGNVTLTIPGGLASIAVASTPTPFSFALTTDQKGKYSIQTGRSSYSYECYGIQNCQFLMSGTNFQRMTNANPSDYGVHVAPNQGPKLSDLVLTCEAKECVITSVENGKSLKRTLKSNEAMTISEAAKISGVVN